MKKFLAISIILSLFNQSLYAQKKTADSLVFKEYYKSMMLSLERNIDQLDNYSNNSISIVYIEMSDYKLKRITYDVVDSSAIAIFKESKLENLDTLYSRICRTYKSPNCIIVQPVSIENSKEMNGDSKANNTPDIRMLTLFYSSFHIREEPKYLMELIKIQFSGLHH
jgi:hypothetical protein